MKKRNLILILIGGIALFIAILALIIANLIMGTDFATMFTSRWAIFIYVFLGIYVLIVAYILIADKVRKL